MSEYYKKVWEKYKKDKWSHKRLGNFLRQNKGKPVAIALKNLEKES